MPRAQGMRFLTAPTAHTSLLSAVSPDPGIHHLSSSAMHLSFIYPPPLGSFDLLVPLPDTFLMLPSVSGLHPFADLSGYLLAGCGLSPSVFELSLCWVALSISLISSQMSPTVPDSSKPAGSSGSVEIKLSTLKVFLRSHWPLE